MPGFEGLDAPESIPGDVGAPGISGIRLCPSHVNRFIFSGPKGPPGLAGQAGMPGEQRRKYLPPGAPGLPGKPGGPGLPGYEGHVGARGRQGGLGPPGDQGDIGNVGNPGRAGVPGAEGAQGLVGDCHHCDEPRTSPGFFAKPVDQSQYHPAAPSPEQFIQQPRQQQQLPTTLGYPAQTPPVGYSPQPLAANENGILPVEQWPILTQAPPQVSNVQPPPPSTANVRLPVLRTESVNSAPIVLIQEDGAIKKYRRVTPSPSLARFQPKITTKTTTFDPRLDEVHATVAPVAGDNRV